MQRILCAAALLVGTALWPATVQADDLAANGGQNLETLVYRTPAGVDPVSSVDFREVRWGYGWGGPYGRPYSRGYWGGYYRPYGSYYYGYPYYGYGYPYNSYYGGRYPYYGGPGVYLGGRGFSIYW